MKSREEWRRKKDEPRREGKNFCFVLVHRGAKNRFQSPTNVTLIALPDESFPPPLHRKSSLAMMGTVNQRVSVTGIQKKPVDSLKILVPN
jgi:hypothetical protein